MSDHAKQSWNASLYEDKHSFVWKHGAAVVDLLAPRPGERILDLGCGTGHLTAKIAEAGASVIGIDSAAGMIDQARASYPNLRFELADARNFTFPEPFDAVFSNAALHWIREADQVIACVHKVLRPGGRFVAELGGKGNVRGIVAAMTSAVASLGLTPPTYPPFFPALAEYAGLLEQAGLEVTYAILFDRLTPLEGAQGMRRWVDMFGGMFVKAVPEEQREDFYRRVENQLRPTLFRDGTWLADYRRLRFQANRDEGVPV